MSEANLVVTQYDYGTIDMISLARLGVTEDIEAELLQS